VVQGDTRAARGFLAKASFDVLATDAPYGVQHGSRTEGLSRRPDELLDEALPVWHELLRPAGSLALSWNRLSQPREELEAMLARHGFAVLAPGGPDAFAHRVDQAILRDVVVARKVD
jgi:tRNA G10  N-methylase Trm11